MQAATAQKSTGQCPGCVAILEDQLARFDRCAQAVGSLQEPFPAAGQVVNDVRGVQPKSIEVDDVDVGEMPLRNQAAVEQREQFGGLARQDVHGIRQRQCAPLLNPLGEHVQVRAGIADRTHVRAAVAERRDRVRVAQQFGDVLREVRRRNVDEIRSIALNEIVVQPLLGVATLASRVRRHRLIARRHVLDRIAERIHHIEPLLEDRDEDVRIHCRLGEHPSLHVVLPKAAQSLVRRQIGHLPNAGPEREAVHRCRQPHQHPDRPRQYLTSDVEARALRLFDAPQVLAQQRLAVLRDDAQVEQREGALRTRSRTRLTQHVELVLRIFPIRDELKDVALVSGEHLAEPLQLLGRGPVRWNLVAVARLVDERSRRGKTDRAGVERLLQQSLHFFDVGHRGGFTIHAARSP